MTKDEFTYLVSKEQEGLRRFLLALCLGNRDEADDIAQDSFLKAYMSCKEYEDRGKFRSWLYSIAHHTFLDYRRARRDMMEEEALIQIPDQSYEADASYRYQDLYLALGKLSPKERTSVLLFYMHGYSTREIASIIGTNDDSIRKQLSRGREQLRKIIKR